MSQTDAIHQHVQQYLAQHPEHRRGVQRQGEGEYVIDGRPVKVGFCRQGFLVVHDGPMRQPFTDYMEKKEASAVYHNQGLKTSKLENLAKESRISFGDEGNRYSRLDAMKVAKEQAKFREKAATHMTEGGFVPSDLRENYQKAIDAKLGKRSWRPNQSAQQTPPESAAPSWWPGSPQSQPAPATPAAAAAAPAAPSTLFGTVPDLLGVARKPAMAGVATPMVGVPGAMPMMAGGYHPRPMPGRLFGA